MLKCPQCGHEHEDHAVICEKCSVQLQPPPVSALNPISLDELHAASEQVNLSTEANAGNYAPDWTSKTVEEENTNDLVKLITLEPNQPDPNSSNISSSKSSFESPKNAETPIPPSTQLTHPATVPEIKPKLLVIRGERINIEYPIYPGKNYIGRMDEKPVDIDLEDQERTDRIWSSRQHAIIHFEDGILTLEDLNSLNGTFVNRSRIQPGQVRQLQANDVIQIGTVQMKVLLG